MGLFSFRKKDAEAVPPKRGNRRSGRAGSRTAGGGEYSEHEQLDPLLPEKQRARRRLVGACALVLAAVIILPMVLAPEPKPATDDIAIQIPGKDTNTPPVRVKPSAQQGSSSSSSTNAPATVATTPTPTPSTSATASTDASLDKGEETFDPTKSATTSVTPPVAQAKPDVKPEAKPEQHADAKPAPKPEAKPEQHAAAKPKPADDPIAQFAQNNAKPAQAAKPAQSADPIAQFAQNNTPAKPAAAAGNGKFLIRVGAFSSEDSAKAWLSKLKQAHVPGYMEKKKIDDRQLFLLRAGPFPDRNSAEAAGKKIRDAGLTAQVVEAG